MFKKITTTLLSGLLASVVFFGCGGGGEGDTCDPFPSNPSDRLKTCQSGLVCVGTKSTGRCVTVDGGP